MNSKLSATSSICSERDCTRARAFDTISAIGAGELLVDVVSIVVRPRKLIKPFPNTS